MTTRCRPELPLKGWEHDNDGNPAMSHEEPAEQYNDTNERDIQRKQAEPVEDSQAITQDDDIDAESVNVLPGTGGPDDVGDVEEPSDYNRDGRPSEES